MNEHEVILMDRKITNFVAKQSSAYRNRFDSFIESTDRICDALSEARSTEAIDLLELLLEEQVKSLSEDFPEIWDMLTEDYKAAFNQ